MIHGTINAGPDFRQRMADRLARWYRGADPHPDPARQKRRRETAALVNKSLMHDYARARNIPLPRLYAAAQDVAALDFASLPEHVVIKPNNSADSDCVMVFGDGIEHFSGRSVLPSQRAAFVREAFAKGRFLNHQTLILAEEFLRDHDPAYRIPRDYKIYVAGGQAHVILVVDRNHPRGQYRQSFHRPDWTVITDAFQTAHLPGPPPPPPARLPELIGLAERIAADIGCFMRLDFYITPDRVVFGEFTPYPDAGTGYTRFGNHMLCNLMNEFPDEF